MLLRLDFLHDWRHIWSWWSVKAAALLVFLGSVQLAAQQFEANTAFAAMTHSQWWLVAKTLIAAAIPILSNIRQPVVATVAPVVPNLKEAPVNNVWTEVLSHLPALATMAEQIAPNSQGVAKAAAVTNAVAQIVPAVAPMLKTNDGAAKMNAYLAAAVAMLNMLSPIFQKPQPAADTASTVTQAFNVPVSAFPNGSTGPA